MRRVSAVAVSVVFVACSGASSPAIATMTDGGTCESDSEATCEARQDAAVDAPQSFASGRTDAAAAPPAEDDKPPRGKRKGKGKHGG